MIRSSLAAAALALLLLASCKSPEEKLIDRRTDLRATLDELYEAYTGPAETTGGAKEANVVGRLFASVERAQFDEYCLALGRGERPFALSGRLESFMKERRNARTCREAAETQLEIEKLEGELRAARGGRSP